MLNYIQVVQWVLYASHLSMVYFRHALASLFRWAHLFLSAADSFARISSDTTLILPL
jgi:hypothetical protein